MRVRRFGAAFAPFGVGMIVMSGTSCKPDGGVQDGLGPIYEDGVSELQFVAPCGAFAPIQAGFQPNPTTDVRAQVPVPMPFDHRSWRGQALDAEPETCDTQGTNPTGFCAPYLPASTTQGFNIPTVDLQGLGLPPPAPMCVRYASTIVHTDLFCDGQHALRQQEVLLFARDPEEVYTAMQDPKYVEGDFCSNWQNGSCGALTDQSWQDDTREVPNAPFGDVSLPRSVSIPYPPTAATPQNALGNGIAWSTNRLREFDFYPNASHPVGPGTGPNGTSSVKSAHVVQHGFCSHYIDTTNDIFSKLADTLWTEYQDAVHSQGTCGCVTIDRDFIHMLSFLHQAEPETNDQHGGFFLNFALRNEFCGVDLGTTDTARYNMAYEWQLTSAGGTVADMTAFPPKPLDGRPVLTPKFVSSHADGRDGSALEEKFFSNLNVTLPRKLFETADRELVYYGKPKVINGSAPLCPNHGDADNCFPCTPSGADFGADKYPRHDPRVPVVPDADLANPPAAGAELCNDPNGAFMAQLWADIGDPASHANLTPQEIAKVRSVAFSKHGGFYDRIRCNSYHDNDKNKDISRCEYVIPVKRVVALPDQVELVFLDDNKEVANPAYPIFLVASGTNLGKGAGYPLCDRAPLCPETIPDSPPAIPAPPRYVTATQPFFNRSFARYTVGAASNPGSQCGGVGTAFVCNPVSCALGQLVGGITGWVSARFF